MATKPLPSVPVIKESLMWKRSQEKGTFKFKVNFKERVFVLTEDELSYHEGTPKKRGKLKGKVDLSTVKVVEAIDDDALNKKYGFQVQYEWTLYVIAGSDEERDDWIHNIRDKVLNKNKFGLLTNYHSGIYVNNRWTCCRSKSKTIPGCKVSEFSNKEEEAVPEEKLEASPPLNLKLQENCNKKKNSNAFEEYIAMCDFDASLPGDLSLRKDHSYKILEKSEMHWWLAEDADGNQGYIPANFLRILVGLESNEWFLGDLTKQECDTLLQSDEKDGTFLVRNSRNPGTYTLSLVFQGMVKHYHIKQDSDEKYYVTARHKFDTIPELIYYHRHNSAGLVIRLRYPYSKGGNAPSTPGLGHDIFEIPRDELTICKQIGGGKFGTVHEGIWLNKRKVAIKKLKQGSMSEDDFIDEAKVMWGFQHKHLLKLYGICSQQKPLYIVTELMSQGSLLQCLKKNVQLQENISSLLEILYQVCSAMKYLEELNFIHRDLAARNCLVGDRNIVKVCDFGLARHLLDDEYTASEGSNFPVRWASPEVFCYSKFSSKSDVWAYGILCWEVFSGGKTPYYHLNNTQLAQEISRGYRLEKPRDCPEEVFYLMSLCWELKPENRPSFTDLLECMRGLTEDYGG